MALQIIGKQCASRVYAELAPQIALVHEHIGRAPSLHVVVAGTFEPSEIYIRNKKARAAECGIDVVIHRFGDDAATAEILACVQELNVDRAVDAILVQTPLPAGVDQQRVLIAIDPSKDADGFHPLNMGILAAGGHPPVLPCTPAGCMEMLRQTGIDPRGKRAVVIGRSIIVGRPMAFLLLNADATVTICHSKTTDVRAIARTAEILVVAIGTPGFITGEDVLEGACVIDVGINRSSEGALVGDVDYASVSARAGWITPVPGGVGPMTIAMLLHNTVALANRSLRIAETV